MFYQIKLKAANGFINFLLIIPAFMEKCLCFEVASHPRGAINEQLAQISERSCGNGIALRNDGYRVFDSNRMYGTPCTCLSQRNAEESRFLAVAFDQMDPSIIQFR